MFSEGGKMLLCEAYLSIRWCRKHKNTLSKYFICKIWEDRLFEIKFIRQTGIYYKLIAFFNILYHGIIL